MLTAFFMLCMLMSLLILLQTFYVYMREQGLLSFLPRPIQHLLTGISFFDILVSIFIYKKFSKTIVAIVTPFLEADTPEQAKKMLKRQKGISSQTQKLLFRKVSSNTA
jgi:hypothetical protein